MLTNAEAEYLIGVLKRIEKPQFFSFPLANEHKIIDVVSIDEKESFIIDINRARIKLKCTYQSRYRKDIVLLRLDVNGAPHTNPDGKQMECPHLHIYKEGYDDRWAYELPPDFSDSYDLIEKLIEFLDYCKVTDTDKLNIQEVM